MKNHETHTICQKRFNQKGENLCCWCSPHSHCEFKEPTPQKGNLKQRINDIKENEHLMNNQPIFFPTISSWGERFDKLLLDIYVWDSKKNKTLKSFISAELTFLLDTLKDEIEKDSDIRTAKADGNAEDNFDFGYDTKKKEVLQKVAKVKEIIN